MCDTVQNAARGRAHSSKRVSDEKAQLVNTAAYLLYNKEQDEAEIDVVYSTCCINHESNIRAKHRSLNQEW